jgi:hypothetical protein
MKPVLVSRKSPLKDKYGKLGSLYNPNNVDPRNFQVDPMLDKPAGVITNYGVGDSNNYYVDEQSPYQLTQNKS